MGLASTIYKLAYHLQWKNLFLLFLLSPKGFVLHFLLFS